MKVYKGVAGAFICLLLAPTTYAQRFLGVANGDYNTANSIFLNPANIAGCSEKISVSLFSFGISGDNNLGTFKSIGDLTSGNTNAFDNANAKYFNMLVPVAEIRGPGVIIGLNDKHKQSIALTTRIRGINQFNHFDQFLFKSVTDTVNTSSENYNYQANDFNWTAHIWSEIGVSYGIVLVDNDADQLKAGITLRYLAGIDYLSLKGKNLDVNYRSGSDSFYASNSDIEFASNVINSDNAIRNGITASSLLGSFFGSKEGGGMGADIGASYSHTFGGTAGSDDAHKLSFSAAVTDIGAIKYKADKNFVINVSGNGYLTGTGLSNHLSNYTDFRNYMVAQGYHADTGAIATKVYMPTSMLLSADYQVYQRIFINATYIGNLANRQNYGNSYYNQFTVTPRYDTKLLSVGMPITYSALAHDMKLGLGFRIGGFFIGSDDMLALLSNNQHGFGAYAGGYIPIYRKEAKNDFR